MHDYVDDGISGVFVELGDSDALRSAILRLWSDDAELERLAEGARAWADRHTDEFAARRRLDDLVSELSGRSGACATITAR